MHCTNSAWDTNETIREVATTKFLYTTNNGVSWKPIATLTGNPGGYSWTIPAVASVNCRVKVALYDSAGLPLGNDMSDNLFTIQP
jgi:hypothetical protein